MSSGLVWVVRGVLIVVFWPHLYTHVENIGGEKLTISGTVGYSVIVIYPQINKACVVCDRSKEHGDYKVVPIEEAALEYKGLVCCCLAYTSFPHCYTLAVEQTPGNMRKIPTGLVFQKGCKAELFERMFETVQG